MNATPFPGIVKGEKPTQPVQLIYGLIHAPLQAVYSAIVAFGKGTVPSNTCPESEVGQVVADKLPHLWFYVKTSKSSSDNLYHFFKW